MQHNRQLNVRKQDFKQMDTSSLMVSMLVEKAAANARRDHSKIGACVIVAKPDAMLDYGVPAGAKGVIVEQYPAKFYAVAIDGTKNQIIFSHDQLQFCSTKNMPKLRAVRLANLYGQLLERQQQSTGRIFSWDLASGPDQSIQHDYSGI